MSALAREVLGWDDEREDEDEEVEVWDKVAGYHAFGIAGCERPEPED